MNIVTNRPYTVFRNDYNGYSFYKLGISKKSQNGEWINGYIRCQFRKNVEVENRTRIYFKKAWLNFYLKDKETILCIFIDEFETVDETIENSKMPDNNKLEEVVNAMVKEDDPFKDFGEEVIIDENQLPF